MLLCLLVVCNNMLSFFFFFKQKTAYEMRISDWSSDVCSSDLHLGRGAQAVGRDGVDRRWPRQDRPGRRDNAGDRRDQGLCELPGSGERGAVAAEIGRASCRERVCQYV